jgi:glyoxylase-like metal-dependent hydrolase (beta-lactamase superfamily II)/rhodanese-related sulfurtransferase
MKEEKHSIDPETLRRWLAEGRDVQVLDIRKSADRAEWSIPGSIHVDAYEALKAGDPAALANVLLREGVPVVTVCGIGRIACVAAERLAARGIDAMPLDGGMKAWSSAWNTAEIDLTGDVRVVQFRRTGKGCLSYLIGSGAEAAVLDASLEPQVYIELARTRGWRITRVLETHVHADHLSRSRRLAQETGAELHLPEQNRVSFAHHPVGDGDLIPIGSDSLRALRTPGHTIESTCYLLECECTPQARVAFTGDTLFLAGIGRPDLGADQSGAQDRAAMLFRSLQRLLSLDPSTLVLPGHHSEPIAFDGKRVAATLAEVRAKVPILGESEPVFARQVLARIPPPPPNYEKIVQLNEAGVFPEGDPRDLESGANRCAVS